MFPSTPESKLNPQIYGEACEWLVELRTGAMEAVSRERFDAWLRKSPEHLRAYLEVSSLWEDVALHDPLRSVSAEAHIARAKTQGNLVPFAAPDDSRTFEQLPELRARIRRPWGFALAASVVAALLAVGFEIDVHRGVYTTGIGEERSLTLADGSVIELNAESRIRVSYQTNTREVELLSGEALFKVVHNPSRPFVVESGAAIIRDLGTVFDVYRKPKGTTVTVIEGQVAVGPASPALAHPDTPHSADGASMSSSAAASGGEHSRRSGQGADIGGQASGDEASHEELLLNAGEQVTVLPTVMLPPIHVDVAAAIAWSDRKLVFDSAPLRQVVRSFNRYNARPIVIEDPTLENFRVIGVFSSTDPSSLIRFLSAQPGISVIENAKEVRITREDEKKAPLR